MSATLRPDLCEQRRQAAECKRRAFAAVHHRERLMWRDAYFEHNRMAAVVAKKITSTRMEAN